MTVFLPHIGSPKVMPNDVDPRTGRSDVPVVLDGTDIIKDKITPQTVEVDDEGDDDDDGPGDFDIGYGDTEEGRATHSSGRYWS